MICTGDVLRPMTCSCPHMILTDPSFLLSTPPRLHIAPSSSDVSGDEDEPDAPSQERVTDKFARPESDKIKQAREKSYHYLKKRQDEMPWVPTTVHKRNSTTSEVSARVRAIPKGGGEWGA